METELTGHIFQAMIDVKQEINAQGVAKERENKKQGFNYRGIDDALNSFSGPFARNDIITTFTFDMVAREPFKTDKGTPMMMTVVSCVCTFLSLRDGSTITVGPFYGEASDVLDKSMTKAHSVAVRNLLFTTFTVPFSPEEPEQDESDRQIGGDDVPAQKGNAERTIQLGISSKQLLDTELQASGMTEKQLLNEFGGVSRSNLRDAVHFIRNRNAS